MTTFREWIPDLAPAHMSGPRMRSFLGAVGAEMDAQAEQFLQARLSANPFAGGANAAREGAARLADGRLIECEPAALPAIAEQRGIRLYPTEPTLSKRVRCARWWQLHAARATHRGELEHAQTYFLGLCDPLPVIHLVHANANRATWHTRSAGGVYSLHKEEPSNFDYDGSTSSWSRFVAIVEMEATGLAPPPNYGDGHEYGDGSLYGVGLTAAQMADVAGLFLDWQAAHSRCLAVLLNWGSPFDPAGTPAQDADGRWSLPNGKWGSTVDPGTGKATRPAGVQWIYEV